MDTIYLINQFSRGTLGRIQRWNVLQWLDAQKIDRVLLDQSDPSLLSHNEEGISFIKARGYDVAFLPSPDGITPDKLPDEKVGAKWLMNVPAGTGGPMVVFTGKRTIRSVLMELLPYESAREGYIVQPDGCINILRREGSECKVALFGEVPVPKMNRENGLDLLRYLGISEPEILRGTRIADVAIEIARRQIEKGSELELDEIEAAAVLCALFGDRDFVDGIEEDPEKVLSPEEDDKIADLFDWMGVRNVAESLRNHRRIRDKYLSLICGPMIVFLANHIVSDGISERDLKERKGKGMAPSQAAEWDLIELTAAILQYP